MIRSEWGIKACKHAAEQEDADRSGVKLKITALAKMFKVFTGEFEGEPFLKGSPSIILLLNLLLYRFVLVVELVVGA